ncbi:MAG: aspartate kinase, partial [Anaerolineae bacterium]
MLIVMKFGGTSVGSVPALQNLVDIVRRSHGQGDQVVLVVSAMSGVTDMLLNAAHQAEAGDEAAAQGARVKIGQKHAEATLHFLGDTPERTAVLSEIDSLL